MNCAFLFLNIHHFIKKRESISFEKQKFIVEFHQQHNDITLLEKAILELVLLKSDPTKVIG